MITTKSLANYIAEKLIQARLEQEGIDIRYSPKTVLELAQKDYVINEANRQLEFYEDVLRTAAVRTKALLDL